MPFLRFVAALAILAPVLAGQEAPAASELIAHEWGTFTSVAGIDGAAVQWAPLSGTPDLPCFVERLSPRNLKYAPGIVRMETPVLYFYATNPLIASVSVRFPRGLITEWYPKATKVSPDFSGTGIRTRLDKAQVDWESIQVSPSKAPDFPTSASPSRYFAARNTDATPIQIGKQQEKFIFYRGMGDFDVALQPKFLPDGRLQINNTGTEPIALAIVFENHAGTIGYHVIHSLTQPVYVDPSELNGTVDSLRQELTDSLIEFGLYEKEALAMIDTWHDAWFEEGMRVFYIVPRSAVDAVLPLSISPQPTSTNRVFVGRVELLSARVRQTISVALETGEVDTLAKFGRFLNPFLEQIRPSSAGIRSERTNEYLQQAFIKMEKELQSGSCVK